jgi:hypothetical protein
MIEDAIIFSVVLPHIRKRMGNSGEPSEKYESNVLGSAFW